VGNLEHMVMPAIVLGAGLSAVLMRQMRSAMLESLGADYVRTARAKGLSEFSVVGKHALRNSLITVTTVIGLQLGALISGAVITEQIFGIAGFGRLTVDSIAQRDYPLIQGVVLVVAVGYVVVNLFVDLAYSLINPRIRVAGGSSQ
jgi:peptide/nickel transport system permease protein